jgi:anti-anti-sigma factor
MTDRAPVEKGSTTARGEPPVLDQAFDGDSLYPLRAAVAAHGSQAGLSEGRTRDLVLAVHELAANAVRHGAGQGRLRLWATREGVRCEVSDDGAAGGPGASGAADAGAPDGPGGPGAESAEAALWHVEPGHGLWLVRRMADGASVQSDPSGTVAAVSFRLGGPGRRAPFRLDQRAEGACTILAVTGQLDLGSSGEFGGAVGDLIAATPGLRLILDCTQLAWWDSSGLAALITAQQRISRDRAARMIVASLPGALAERLHEAGLADRLTLADSTAAAVTALTPPG